MRSRRVYTLTSIADCKCLVLLESLLLPAGGWQKVLFVGQVDYSRQKRLHLRRWPVGGRGGEGEGGGAGRQDCTVRAANEPSPTSLSGALPRLGRGKCASRTAVPFSGQSLTYLDAQ